MKFEAARAVADAILLEGYVLYPYRATSTKNRYRWTFGVVAPREWSEAGGCESWWIQTQCLVEGTPATTLGVRLRFLQVERRTVEAEDGARGVTPCEVLDTGLELVLPWEEGHLRQVDAAATLGGLSSAPALQRFDVPGEVTREVVRHVDGRPIGRLTRTRVPVRGNLVVRAEPVEAERPLWRVTVRVENVTPLRAAPQMRAEAVRSACVSTHLLLHADGGGFLSVIDPPRWARTAGADLCNVGVYPVLAGAGGDRRLMLASPVILYDHPQIAPESPGDFCDATEIDELLALRTDTLTEEERRVARGTDPRAAAILSRTAGLGPAAWERLHGASRELRDGEMVPEGLGAPSAARRFPPGTRVILRRPRGRTDAQDMLYVGRRATVEGVRCDREGREYLTLILDDDPAAELHRARGRYLYYRPDEVDLA